MTDDEKRAVTVLRWLSLLLYVAAAWPWVKCGLCRRRILGSRFRDHVAQHLRDLPPPDVDAWLRGDTPEPNKRADARVCDRWDLALVPMSLTWRW